LRTNPSRLRWPNARWMTKAGSPRVAAARQVEDRPARRQSIADPDQSPDVGLVLGHDDRVAPDRLRLGEVTGAIVLEAELGGDAGGQRAVGHSVHHMPVRQQQVRPDRERGAVLPWSYMSTVVGLRRPAWKAPGMRGVKHDLPQLG